MEEHAGVLSIPRAFISCQAPVSVLFYSLVMSEFWRTHKHKYSTSPVLPLGLRLLYGMPGNMTRIKLFTGPDYVGANAAASVSEPLLKRSVL